MTERGSQKIFGLAIAAALAALPATAAAQETQRSDTATGRDTSSMGAAQRDTTQQDTSRWGYDTNRNAETQNPPGYRGMERPVNVFPPDSAGEGQRQPGAVEDQVTGTYEDSAWRDTTGQRQNPAGYRGMERPVGSDTAQSGQQQGQSGQSATGDRGNTQELEQYRQRLGEMGYKVEKMSKSEKKEWQKRNRSGQSGTDMQRQGGANREEASGRDTTRVGETTPKVPADSTRRLPAARGDTTGQSSGTQERTGTTSSDTTNQ